MEDNRNISAPERGEQPAPEQQKPATKLQKFLQFLKFTAFSASAGVIQLLSTTLLHQWTGLLLDYYYIAYAIGLTLSVIWNFTFNRKFTFKASSNVPIAMSLVVLYNLIIVVPLGLGGDKLVELWGNDYGIVVTVITLLINFITEFFWDKFIVFNDKVINSLAKKFSRNKGEQPAEASAAQADAAEEEAPSDRQPTEPEQPEAYDRQPSETEAPEEQTKQPPTP